MLVGGSNISSDRFPFITLMLIVFNIGMFFQSFLLNYNVAASQSSGQSFGYERSISKEEKQLQSYYEDYGFSLQDFTERQEYYSIISHMFIHGGVLHLIGNMLMLWAVGLAMESALGSKSYALYYFVCGLAAALTQGFLNIDCDVPTIGASGAIAGLMGGFFILFGPEAKLKVLIWLMGIPRIINVPALLFAFFWLGQQLLGSMADTGGIAWMAHLGGCVAGGGLALIFKNSLRCEINKDRSGNLQIKHEEDTNSNTEADLFDQVLELHPVSVVVAEIMGDDAPVFVAIVLQLLT